MFARSLFIMTLFDRALQETEEQRAREGEGREIERGITGRMRERIVALGAATAFIIGDLDDRECGVCCGICLGLVWLVGRSLGRPVSL